MSPTLQSLFSPAGLREVFNRWKYQLGLAGVLALVISAAVAWSMPNIYNSVAVFLPTSLQSADPDRLVEGTTKLELGTRVEDLDRVISIGESLPVAEIMIRKFDLYRHYSLGPPTDDLEKNKALQEFNSNLTVIHNERDAIELTFRDRDKHLAARVANAMVTTIDSINQQLTLENRRNVLELYRQRSLILGRNYEQTRQALIRARYRYGIFGLEQQGRYLAKEVIETQKELDAAEGGGGGNAAGLRRALRGLTKAEGGRLINLEGWTKGSDSINLVTSRLNDLQTRFVAARAAYEQAEISLRSRVSSLYLLQKAQPATKKTRPFRGAIVAGSVVLTLLVSIVVILLLEAYRRQAIAAQLAR